MEGGCSLNPYFFTIIFAAIFAFYAEKSNNTSNTTLEINRYSTLTRVYLSCSIAPLVFTAGFRYYVGTDYGAYYNGLSLFGGKLVSSIKSLDEPVLPILASFLRLFTNDGIWFIFICSFLTILLVLVTSFKHSSSFVFLILLFVFGRIWHGSFNGVRQYLAGAIVFAGHRFIYEKRPIPYLVCVFIAFCTHVSAILLVILYFILRSRFSIKNLLLISVGTIIIASNYEELFSLIGFLKDETIEMTEYQTNAVSVFRTLASVTPAVVVIILYFNRSPNSEQVFYINTLVVNASAMIAASNSTYLARIGDYTGMFVPLALSKLLVFKNKWHQFLIRSTVIILYGIFWIYEISLSSSLSNFQWIWER